MKNLNLFSIFVFKTYLFTFLKVKFDLILITIIINMIFEIIE